MVPPPPLVIAADGDPALLADAPAVYLLWPKEGAPHLGRTNLLRRRIGRFFDRYRFREIGNRVEYWPVASRLEQWLVSYALARRHFPDGYERVLRLPRPAYVKLGGGLMFPRTQVTTRLAGARSVFYGPFASRAVADQFEAGFLDLFQLRRCQEDFTPSAEHPGCMYGEMMKCLRPCQEAVSVDEYSSEARRAEGFLESHGKSLAAAAEAARDKAGAELEFEEAARQHARVEKIGGVVRSGGELARSIDRLHGVAVTASTAPDSVRLWFVRSGFWLDPVDFPVGAVEGKPVSLDARLASIVAALGEPRASLTVHQDHLALLAKWFYSSWRDGEWLAMDGWGAVSYRKLVNAIHRVAKGKAAP